ncbi:MAG: winged helix-turn-helix transcriptional regulator [Oscillospiraceae bacterium]
MHVKRSQFDPQLLKVAQDCALSNNTVLKISTFVQRKNNGTFFTAELAEELHISFRTAARIVEKLEQNGYIVEIGRSVLNGRGRPTRVFQLLR